MASAEMLLPADGMTFDEFLVRLDDGEKADLLDGSVRVAPPDTRTHNSLMGFIASLIDGYASARDIGGVHVLLPFCVQD